MNNVSRNWKPTHATKKYKVRKEVSMEYQIEDAERSGGSREGGFCLSKSWKPLMGSLKLSGHEPRILGDTVPHSWRWFVNKPTPTLPPKLGISLCSLAIYKPPLQPATPTPLCIHNLLFHTAFLSHFAFLRNVRRLLVTANVPSSQTLIILMM
jgi:hypothetical protein